MHSFYLISTEIFFFANFTRGIRGGFSVYVAVFCSSPLSQMWMNVQRVPHHVTVRVCVRIRSGVTSVCVHRVTGETAHTAKVSN